MCIFRNKILTAGLILIGGVVAANAQMSGPFGVKFHTSFPFTVANTTMPAGDYVVRRLGTMRESRYSLILQARDGGRVMVHTVGGSSKTPFLNRTQVVFDTIDGQYFLSEVRSAGEEAGNRIQMSGRQRVLMGQNRPVRRIVVTSSDTGF